MHAVVAEQMRVGLDRAEIVDGDDFNVVALGLDGGAQDVSADPAETIDCNAYGHPGLLRHRPEDGRSDGSYVIYVTTS